MMMVVRVALDWLTASTEYEALLSLQEPLMPMEMASPIRYKNVMGGLLDLESKSH